MFIPAIFGKNLNRRNFFIIKNFYLLSVKKDIFVFYGIEFGISVNKLYNTLNDTIEVF